MATVQALQVEPDAATSPAVSCGPISPMGSGRRREPLPPGPAAVQGMDQQGFMAVISEVAALGQGGLQINELGTSSGLNTLPGS